MYMLMLLDIAIIGGVNLRSNFSPGVLKEYNNKIILKSFKIKVFYIFLDKKGLNAVQYLL